MDVYPDDTVSNGILEMQEWNHGTGWTRTWIWPCLLDQGFGQDASGFCQSLHTNRVCLLFFWCECQSCNAVYHQPGSVIKLQFNILV